MRVDQPYIPKIQFRFTYNIETRIVDQEEALVKAYDMERFYYNMPYGFSDTNVVEEDREIYNDMYRQLDAGEEYVSADFRVSSDRHWARVTIYKSNPESPIYIGVVLDVSERYDWIAKQAELREIEQLRLRSKELEALQLMRAINDSYEMIISVNLTQNKYYMISYERFLNQDADYDGEFDDLIDIGTASVPDDHKEAFYNSFSRKSLLQAHAEGKKSVYLEHQQYDMEGVPHWVATTVMFTDNPFNDDIMEITISQNIDERLSKETRDKLVLKDALLLAERANDAKSDFLSRMSHDIRTPMNAIIGMTTIAKKSIGNDSKIEECLDKIDVSSKFLLNLINDILDLSKIESGKMSVNIKPFSMREVLVSLFNSFQALTSAKNQTFEYEIDSSILEFYKGDALRLEQILMNLLSNACKFTPENGTIKLIMEMAQRDKERDIIHIVVEDNGIGISEEFKKMLFEPFEQNHNEGHDKGSGLGLAIVQNLVHLMGGTISVESQLGEGSQFIIELPLYLPEDSVIKENDTALLHSENNVSEEIVFHGENILVVEDNEFNQEVAKTILEMLNLKVEIASDGLEAIEKFTSSEPGYYTVIFMDIQMPGMDGYETTKQIRESQHKEAATIPIYAMTANAFDTDVASAKQRGMNGHVSKPVDFDVVAQIISKHI